MSKLLSSSVRGATYSALTVPSGGTGVVNFTVNGLLIGNGQSNITTLLPGANGNVLTSNGTNWESGPAPTTLPIQTGNSGKYLTTDGSTASWANVNFINVVHTDVTYSDPTWLTGLSFSKITNVPTASTTVAGTVKVDGTTITISNGVISSQSTGGTRVARMNFVGDLMSMDSDAVFVPEQTITITGITANLTSALTSAGSFSLKKNGTIVATVTLTTNTLIFPVTSVSIAGTHADMFTVSLTATSGKNLTITLIYG